MPHLPLTVWENIYIQRDRQTDREKERGTLPSDTLHTSVKGRVLKSTYKKN